MIDLHIHTTSSDGSCSPKEILIMAERAKLTYISITDHNTCDAYKELSEYKKYYKGVLIPGIELECGFEKVKIEILAYNINIDKMSSWIKENMSDKYVDNKQMKEREHLERVADKIGVVYNKNYLDGLDMKKLFVAPNFIHEVKKHKENLDIVPDLMELHADRFFWEHVSNKDSIWYMDKAETLYTAGKIVDAIHLAGGVAFLAHAFEYPVEDLNGFLDKLLENCNLDGLECYHSTFSEEEVKFLNEYADKHGLFKSGGSDYHGELKKDIQLGVGEGSMKVSEELLRNWTSRHMQSDNQ